MIATPALSSAPRRVLPDAVMISCPRFSAKYGKASGDNIRSGSSGKVISPPLYPFIIRGFTPFALN